MTNGSDFASAAKQWQTDGWALVDGLVPEADIAAAHADLAHLFGTDTFDDYNRSSGFRDFNPPEGKTFRGRQFDGMRGFPFGGNGALNQLFVHPRLLEFARTAMASDDLRIYQAAAWAKAAGDVNYEQPLHQDSNHSLVPHRMEPGFWHMECFLYLTDVDDGCAPPHLVPRSKSGVGYDDLDQHEIAATGRCGSLLAYRSDVWHRGTNFERPDASRQVLVVSFKLPGAEWYGYDAFPRLGSNNYWHHFVAGKTPDELALFGIPRPGHAYWTEATVDALGEKYVGLDVTPWHSAL